MTYRSRGGPIDVTHDIEELYELQALVEHGPDWNTIEDIHIKLACKTSPDKTVEDEMDEINELSDEEKKIIMSRRRLKLR
jgi:hypothetical protein